MNTCPTRILFFADAASVHTRRWVQAVAERFLNVGGPLSGLDYWRCRKITIESNPDRAVWTDGEYIGRTPVTATVMPGALAVVVP